MEWKYIKELKDYKSITNIEKNIILIFLII